MNEKLIPLYMQASNRIEQEICRNNFREGEKLPRLNQLSRMMKLNTSALEKGIQHLIEEGIILRRSPLEYVIVRGARQKLLQKAKDDFYKDKVDVLIKEAERIGISKEELIDYLKPEEANHEDC